MSSLERRNRQDNTLKNIYNYMKIDSTKPGLSKEKYKHDYNKFLAHKRRFIVYRREKMCELYSKEEEMYKKELNEKNKGSFEIIKNCELDAKDINKINFSEERYIHEKPRFDMRKIISAKKEVIEPINDCNDKELFTKIKYENLYENKNAKSKYYEIEFEKERNERIKIDDELRKYHKQLEILKQEELIKMKNYQDSLLQQINGKIQRQMMNLNNKYSSEIEFSHHNFIEYN